MERASTSLDAKEPTIQSLREREHAPSVRALSVSHCSSPLAVRREVIRKAPSRSESRRMSKRKGASEGIVEDVFLFLARRRFRNRRLRPPPSNFNSPPGAINSLFFLTVLTVPPSCFHAASCSPVVAIGKEGGEGVGGGGG